MKVRLGTAPPKRVSWTITKSPAGNLAVALTDQGEICRTAFLRDREIADVLDEWQNKWPETDFQRNASLKVNSEGPCYMIGTDFQQAVWQEIASIPKGQTRTYGEIARRIGNPAAVRAVGTACGANPVPYFVPCHRVLGVTGLGGFSGGLALKKKLLKAEGL